MSDPLAALDGHEYIIFTTFRKNGAAVSTPVWFAVANSKVYILSLADAGKLKRIRSNPQVTFAPGNLRSEVLGTVIKGRARILESETQRQFANQTIGKKYGFTKTLFDLVHALQRALKTRQYIEITPERLL
jgi:PPOX class probable F420-dependent enzyme